MSASKVRTRISVPPIRTGSLFFQHSSKPPHGLTNNVPGGTLFVRGERSAGEVGVQTKTGSAAVSGRRAQATTNGGILQRSSPRPKRLAKFRASASPTIILKAKDFFISRQSDSARESVVKNSLMTEGNRRVYSQGRAAHKESLSVRQDGGCSFGHEPVLGGRWSWRTTSDFVIK